MEIESLKKHLQKVVDIVNFSSPFYDLKLGQQLVIKGNIRINGANGTLWVQPSKFGFDISLSGRSLEEQMSSFMEELFSKKCDGYKQRNKRLGKKDTPFWCTDDFENVVKAVFQYAKTGSVSEQD
jgi:hypothetical protein